MWRSSALGTPYGENTALDRGPLRAFPRGPPNWFASAHQSLLIQNGILHRERRPRAVGLAAGDNLSTGDLDLESSSPLSLHTGLQDSPVRTRASSGCSPKGFPGFTELELNAPH